MRRSCSLAMLILSLVTSQAFARTQCTCKSVNAVGEGNSSCSTAESNGKCTVDFNQFPPQVLQRAGDLLRRAEPSFSPATLDQNLDASFVLKGTRDAQHLADTIVLYMTIAVSTQVNGRPVLSYETSDLRSLLAFAKEQRELLDTIFRKPTNSGRSDTRTFSSGGRFVYAPGCLDVQLPMGLQVMFKAAWSPAAERPRCEMR